MVWPCAEIVRAGSLKLQREANLGDEKLTKHCKFLQKGASPCFSIGCLVALRAERARFIVRIIVMVWCFLVSSRACVIVNLRGRGSALSTRSCGGHVSRSVIATSSDRQTSFKNVQNVTGVRSDFQEYSNRDVARQVCDFEPMKLWLNFFSQCKCCSVMTFLSMLVATVFLLKFL